MCPAGEVCTGLTEGRFCLPGEVDAGVGGGAGGGTGSVDAGTGAGGGGGGTSSGTEMTPGGNGRIGAAAMGCNCNAVDGMLPLVAMGLLLFRRRKSS